MIVVVQLQLSWAAFHSGC